MALPNGVFKLGVYLGGMALNLAHQRVRLDLEYERQLQDFLPILRLAKELGYEDLGRALAPVQIVIDKAEARVEMHLSNSREDEFAINVRPLNLGYSQKYKHSRFVKNCVQITVQSVPLNPGQTPEKPPT